MNKLAKNTMLGQNFPWDELFEVASKYKYGWVLLVVPPICNAVSNTTCHLIDKSWQELSKAADKGHPVEVDLKIVGFKIYPIPEC